MLLLLLLLLLWVVVVVRYTTTLEGLPLQQGEGGLDASTPSGKGVFIYHDYNLTAWAQPAQVDPAVFAVPAVCLAAGVGKCPFP